MWQLESDATSISSGSTAASTAHFPTPCGEADAGTSVPPSKLTVCARLKRPLRNSSPLSFAAHLISAIWVAMVPRPWFAWVITLANSRSYGERRPRKLKWIKTAGAEFVFVNELRTWTHGAIDGHRSGSLAKGYSAAACRARGSNRQTSERHGGVWFAHRRWRQDSHSRRERALRSRQRRRSD